MTFIITLIALLIERFLHWSHLRQWRWYASYQQWLAKFSRLKHVKYLFLAACIVPIMLVVGLLNLALNGWLYGILKLLFGALILIYCLGPANLWIQIFTCINALNKKEDPQAIFVQAQTAFGIGAVTDLQTLHQTLTRAIFLAANERVFAVVFWFILLGPMGAVLYRLTTLARTQAVVEINEVAAKLQSLLDWLPVRLLTFLFALCGHFTQVITYWKRALLKSPEANDAMLAHCGVAALDVMQGNHILEGGGAEKEAVTLLDRAFILGLVILAVIVLLV